MLDVQSFLEAHFGDVEPYQHTDLRVDCPFCGDYKKKFYVSKVTGVYHCWKCGSAGTFQELRKQLPELFPGQSVILNRLVKKEKRVTRKLKGMPDHFKKFANMDEQKLLKNKAYKYLLKKRGLTRSTIFDYEMGYCSMGKFAKRIMVPVFFNNELVSYLGRDYTGKAEKKVLYGTKAEVNPTSMYLFNYDEAKQYKSLLVTEGWVDALKSRQKVLGKGLGVVASFGKNLTKEQVELLIDGDFDEIIFMWDLDAFTKQLEFAEWLCEETDIYFTRISEEDPGEMDEESFFEFLDNREKFDPNKVYTT